MKMRKDASSHSVSAHFGGMAPRNGGKPNFHVDHFFYRCMQQASDKQTPGLDIRSPTDNEEHYQLGYNSMESQTPENVSIFK